MLQIARTMLSLTENGLTFGDDILLATPNELGHLDIAPHKQRIDDVMKAAYGRSMPDTFIPRLHSIAKSWNSGQPSLAAIKLAQLGLRDPTGDPGYAQRMARIEKYNPYHIPAGNEGGGEFTSANYTPTAKTKEQFLSSSEMRYAPQNLRDAIAALEQSKGYDPRNKTSSAMGKYQFLDSTLKLFGLKQHTGANGWGNTNFSQAFNIKSDNDFLHNPDAQEAAMGQIAKGLQPEINHYYNNLGYGGKTFLGVSGDNVTVTKAGLLGALHRRGGPDVSDYFKTYQAKDTFNDNLGSVNLEIETRLRALQNLPYNP